MKRQTLRPREGRTKTDSREEGASLLAPRLLHPPPLLPPPFLSRPRKLLTSSFNVCERRTTMPRR